MVLVCEPEPTRRGALEAAVRAAGGVVVLLADPLAPVPEGCHAALVGTDHPAAGAPELRLIGVLGKRGVPVLACGARVAGWPVAARCRPLLAGARRLLEATAEGFGRELAERLEPLLAAGQAQRAEGERVEEAMRLLGVVGRSRALLELFRWVVRVAPLSGVPALIRGETGSGKELVARALHRLDPRRGGAPFVPVNCAALTRSLAESELFGHRRGAFTGADRERSGLVRAADGGVLFLDEIGELDLELQGKLLRVVQEGQVLGVGHDREIAVDVRVVAATHRDLEAAVAAGRFREDLFHRLSVLPVRVPPLRERPDDLPALVEHFLGRNRGLCPRDVRAGPSFLEALARLPLPGNVRELENLVRQAMAGKDDDSELDLGDLPAHAWRALAAEEEGPLEAPPAPAHAPDPPGPSARPGPDGRPPDPALRDLLDASGWKLSLALRELERLILAAALERTQGNQSETARLLGLSARSIYTKIRKHRLER